MQFREWLYQKGSGMKREQVEIYLRQHGLLPKGGGRRYIYYGFPDQQPGEGYFLRLSRKTIRIIKRSKKHSIKGKSISDKGVTDSVYYGELNSNTVDFFVHKLRSMTIKG